MNKQSLTSAWRVRQIGTDAWIPAQVPGGVHTDLLAAGLIPDPFVGDNERKVQWVAEADWEYEGSFTVDADLLTQPHVDLVADGLDTLATVTLNGHTLGSTENLYRQYRWDVKPFLQTGANTLRVVFASTVKYIAARQAVRPMVGVPQAIPGGPYVRKAPCHFGWDWGPQLPPIGVWKDLRLEAYAARLEDVHVRQRWSGGEVSIEANAIATNVADGALSARLEVIAPDGLTVTQQAEVAANGGASLIALLIKPQLWWPAGYGEQPLYTVRVTLLDAAGAALDVNEKRIGLRTLELRQEPDAWGKSFQFVVNGVKIMAKGANWIPTDSFPTRITIAQLEQLLGAAVAANMNMLRVWGGGLYEDERFYDVCDRLGLLVWQDFTFACSVYPLNDPAFLENVRHEVAENVRRLRHRASLALWCGNNEIEQGWAEWGWMAGNTLDDLRAAYDDFFHRMLPAWVAAEDPDHSYWPSSPSSDTPFVKPNGQQQGDAHYWDVWHGRKPFTAYRDQYPRFMSEFGFQALPPLATIKTYAEPSDWNMTSYVMDQHQKNASGNSLMVGQMLDTFQLPKDFQSLVYLSLALQAEGIRYGVEHWRRHPDRVAGIIYWQLNDCWPVASWSSLDYFGRWKALHYAARRFFAPLLLSIEDAPPKQGLYVSNDGLAAQTGVINWSLETLGGEPLASGEEPVQVAPQSATAVRMLDFADRITEANRRDTIFVAELWQGDTRVARQVATFVPTKHLLLSDPGLSADVAEANGTLSITLKARRLARLVEVALEDADVVFSDNYFDLPAGRSIEITCPLPSGWTATQAVQALRLRSVVDTYGS
ncbi:MAG TPA: glycoside hydrolase family 2 protein [Anaerolineales bacterium]|nr:glycoside hydrolase family 2 protein [Anaerolineales bacterium]HRF47608.1 glycoside hydrolase family 2 protein [Anaerolineales bacterium]